MSFLCPACHGALPAVTARAVQPCPSCGVAVDLRDVDTAAGGAPGLVPDRDLTGTTLGAYALTARLGSGGMGIVYAADGPDGPVAVKVLARAPASDPGLRERFQREAEALLSIVHPAIVRVFARGEQDGVAWYAMERGDGEDLSRRLARGPLPGAEVEVLARQLLSALVLIHARGLVHRDVKPSNVLLFASGAKLCDFGVARLDGTRTLTESMAVVGSLKYMAPEQRSGKTTAASDLYALGVLLFEAATGALPDERPLAEIEPRRLRKLIGALLAARPAERPTAEAALRALEPSARGSRWAVAGAVAVATVAVVAVLLVGPWGGPRDEVVAPAPPLASPPAVATASVARAPVALAALVPAATSSPTPARTGSAAVPAPARAAPTKTALDAPPRITKRPVSKKPSPKSKRAAKIAPPEDGAP